MKNKAIPSVWPSFVDRLGDMKFEIERAYLPPNNSKYNPIERCWGILEQHWNGTMSNSFAIILLYAAAMTWRKIHPSIRENTTTY